LNDFFGSYVTILKSATHTSFLRNVYNLLKNIENKSRIYKGIQLEFFMTREILTTHLNGQFKHKVERYSEQNQEFEQNTHDFGRNKHI